MQKTWILNSAEVADVVDDSTLHSVFIKEVEEYIRSSFRHYWA